MPKARPTQNGNKNAARIRAIPLPELGVARTDSVQSHGVLMVLSEPELLITQVSQNCARILGQPVARLLGRPVDVAVGRSHRPDVERAIIDARLTGEASFVITPHPGSRRRFDATVHRTDGALILEIEPLQTVPQGALLQLLHETAGSLAAIERENELNAVCALAADSIRSVSRFGRVDVYRYDCDGASESMARSLSVDAATAATEAGEEPAIVPQTEFRPGPGGSRIHLIRDLFDAGAAVTPQLNPLTGKRLDLGNATLRSCPADYARQLAKRNASASMLLPLFVDQKVWGFIVCENAVARSLPHPLRNLCVDIAHGLAAQLTVIERHKSREQVIRLSGARERLLQAVAQNARPCVETMHRHETDLLGAVGADGAALYVHDKAHLLGNTPAKDQVVALAKWLITTQPYAEFQNSTLPVFSTRALADLFPPALAFGDRASGVVAIPINGEGCLMWFRPGRRADQPGVVRTALPWTDAEIASAQGLAQLGWALNRENLESKLADNRQHARTLLDSISEAVLVIDRSAIVKVANESAQRILGVRQQELVGESIFEAAWRMDRPDGLPWPGDSHPLLDTLASGRPLANELMSFLRPDGSRTWVTVNARVLHSAEDGKPDSVALSFSDSTEIRESQAMLVSMESRLRAMLAGSPSAVVMIDATSRILYLSPAHRNILGFSDEEVLGRSGLELMHRDDVPHAQAVLADAVQHPGRELSMEFRLRHKNGNWRWIAATGSNMLSDPSISALVIHYRDITAEKHAREMVALAREHHHAVVENLAEAVIVRSTDGQIVAANSAASKLYGIDIEQLIGVKGSAPGLTRIREDGSELSDYDTPSSICLRTGVPVSDFRMGLRREDGSVTWVLVNCRPIRPLGENGLGGAVVSFRDITERKRVEEELDTLAHFDPLTQLPNRGLLRDRLEQAMARARRNGEIVGLMLIDLDRFKEINDSLGYAAGDSVLKEVGQRLSTRMRNTDTVSRFGGDEFVVLLEGCTDAAQVVIAAGKARDALDMPISIGEHELFLGGSIGISVFPDDGDNQDDLFKSADIALYDAKREGGNTFRLFSRDLQVKTANELSMAAKLRRALDRNELQLAYQPQIDVRTGRITGVEALLRWNSPELGEISPVQFIPVAEETGLIVPIGEWVLKTAATQNLAWQAAGFEPFAVAVNLSARQFRDRQLVQKLAHAITSSALDPRWLELEITESVIMHHTAHTVDTLQRIVALGLKIAIDDFGTGYSSLAYLKRFPVHKLKIDRAFVRDISTDRDDAAIVRAVITLARAMDLKVIAEGVETPEQLKFLDGLNCDEYQGYLFSRPLPASGITALLEARRSAPG